MGVIYVLVAALLLPLLILLLLSINRAGPTIPFETKLFGWTILLAILVLFFGTALRASPLWRSVPIRFRQFCSEYWFVLAFAIYVPFSRIKEGQTFGKVAWPIVREMAALILGLVIVLWLFDRSKSWLLAKKNQRKATE